MNAPGLADIERVVGPSSAAPEWLPAVEMRRRAAEVLPAVITRELWKYTPIQGFLDALATAPADAAARLLGADQPGIRAVPLEALSTEDRARLEDTVARRLDGQRHPMADLSLLRARGGWLIDVAERAERPLEIHWPAAGIVPVFLFVAPGASLTMSERGAASGVRAQMIHAELGAGAQLTHRRADLDRDLPHYALVNVRADRDAGYRLHQACVGGKRRRLEIHVTLDGPGAEASLSGAYVVEAGQHLDQQLVLEHRAGHTTSRQKFHGIGAGKGRSVFNGRIHIHRHAPGSDATLSNKNLALHPEAEMNTKPELEIYTDDVSCAHGATVGQISMEALYYLRARGIPEARARRLLAHGFLRECLDPELDDAAGRLLEALR